MKTPLLPGIFRITMAVALGALTLWVAGFLAFAGLVLYRTPDRPGSNTDVIVVLTGGTGRIEKGFSLMAHNRAKAMLVTGVHPNVTLRQLADRWPGGNGADRAAILSHCCIFIEHKALSTEDNAAETLAWLGRNGGPRDVSMRIVTSDYHMPRALLLYRRAIPQATILAWPVESANRMTLPFWRTLFLEYSKTLLTWIS